MGSAGVEQKDEKVGSKEGRKKEKKKERKMALLKISA
jgi:hypothetical protein